MKLYRQESQRMFTTPNAFVFPLATERLGATQVSVIRQRMESGKKNPLHTQSTEEVMVMLRGEVRVVVDGAVATMVAGDVLTVGPEVPHSIENTGAGEAEWLIISPIPMRFHGPDGNLVTPEWAQ